ncbi:MAG: SDR family oxidoreductase [Robiginitalea sp.]|uniref:SDR family oxidoreductase n=1 Tax=Robiginitalea sp. TaxID=1902411 RepID=UPI003C7224FC
MEVRDKVIWITGASSGIGKSLAQLAGQKGARLILSGRNTARLKEVQNTLPNPEWAHILPLDLSVTESLQDCVEQALGCFNRIDILVNNAGISQRSLIADTDIAVYERLIQVNYLGTVALSKALLPHFIREKRGHFVVVTSLMGKFGSPWRSGYCGAKHALHGFFDVLRMEHQKDGIAVTLVCPGFVNTDVARNALVGDGAAQSRQDQATATGMDPERFARKMLKAIERRKMEVYIGGKEVSGVYIKRFFPGLLHKLVLRSKVV